MTDTLAGLPGAPTGRTPAGLGPPAGLLDRPRRPRVAARLDTALDPAVRLTLVSAPPGYGKSVAVAGWIATRRLPCAWVVLDAADDDPMRLARDLLTRLDGARPGSAAVADLLGPGTAPDPRSLARLVLDAVDGDDHEVVLVLDDLHLLRAPGALALVGSLLEGMPPFAHVVLVTREDPALRIGRLRAHGALVELRAEDLRFTPDEAAGLLADAGLTPGAGVTTALVERTEGWAAALQLGAIILRSATDHAAAVEAFSGEQRFVIDYLADEVMAGLDPELGDFLVRLSVADAFDAPLAAALTGRADAGALIDRAWRANLFVVPLDGPERRFRLHGLFANYLRARLTVAERAVLHHIAGRWLEAAGDRRGAINHVLSAGAWGDAARLIAAEGRVAFEAGEIATLRGWLAALPPETLAGDADLVALDAWARFYAGRLAEAAALAARHLASMGKRGAAEGRLLVLRALVATTTSPVAEDLARAGIALLAGDPLFESLGLQAAGLAQLARGDLAASLGTLRDAFERALAVGLPMAVLPAVNPLGHALQATGRRDEAEALARRVLAAYRGASGASLPIAWSAHLVLGIALYEGGEVAEARRELERGLAAAAVMGVGTPILAWAVPHIALARQATGDVDGALAISRPPRTAPGAALMLPSLAAETEARIRLAQGDLGWASRWADTAHGDAPPGSPMLAMLGASASVTAARVRLAEGRAVEALALLGPADAAYAAWGSIPERISTLLLRAVAHRVAGRRALAVEALGEAVRLAAPGGYVRRFVDDGPGLRPLLPAVRALAPTFVALVDRAVVASGGGSRRPPTGRGTTVGIGADGELVESLTGRELEVLRILATGATNAGLADRIGVSSGTAKWHVAHILAKLGARSRTQAVVRAQRLGLL